MEREEEEAFVERRLQELGQTEGKGNDGRFCLDVRKWEAIGRGGFCDVYRPPPATEEWQVSENKKPGD